MGSGLGGGGGGYSQQVYSAKDPEYVGTPALARNVSRDSSQAQAVQTEARSRLRGIRSTFNRYDSVDNSGTSSKLG